MERTELESGQPDIESHSIASGIENDNSEVGEITGEPESNFETGAENREKTRRTRRKANTEENDPTVGIDEKIRKPRTKTAGRTPRTKGVDLTKEGARQIASYICGIHAIADIACGKTGILCIEESQAEELTNSVLQVMEQYKMKPNPKAVAWANLAGCIAVIYTPKVLAFRAMMVEKRKAETSPQQTIPTSAPLASMVFN